MTNMHTWYGPKYRGVFKIQSKVYEGDFSRKQPKNDVNYFHKKAPLEMFDWVLYTPLKYASV